MPRKTVYNNITSPELIQQVSKENKELMNEFIDYLKSIVYEVKVIIPLIK